MERKRLTFCQSRRCCSPDACQHPLLMKAAVEILAALSAEKSGKEKKGGAGVTATPHYSAAADWLHFTCSTSKSQIANLLFTRSPLWHEGTNLPGQKKNSRCGVYLELAMFHLLLTLGDMCSQAGIFSMAHATSAVFFDVCKDTRTYGTVRCDRTVCRMDFHPTLMLAFN